MHSWIQYTESQNMTRITYFKVQLLNFIKIWSYLSSKICQLPMNSTIDACNVKRRLLVKLDSEKWLEYNIRTDCLDSILKNEFSSLIESENPWVNVGIEEHIFIWSTIGMVLLCTQILIAVIEFNWTEDCSMLWQ